jgi:hypothetical protein
MSPTKEMNNVYQPCRYTGHAGPLWRTPTLPLHAIPPEQQAIPGYCLSTQSQLAESIFVSPFALPVLMPPLLHVLMTMTEGREVGGQWLTVAHVADS